MLRIKYFLSYLKGRIQNITSSLHKLIKKFILRIKYFLFYLKGRIQSITSNPNFLKDGICLYIILCMILYLAWLSIELISVIQLDSHWTGDPMDIRRVVHIYHYEGGPPRNMKTSDWITHRYYSPSHIWNGWKVIVTRPVGFNGFSIYTVDSLETKLYIRNIHEALTYLDQHKLGKTSLSELDPQSRQFLRDLWEHKHGMRIPCYNNKPFRKELYILGH